MDRCREIDRHPPIDQENAPSDSHRHRLPQLVELLARNESRQEQKDRALREAVESRRLDMIEVLVENGARIQAVPLGDVLLTWPRRYRISKSERE